VARADRIARREARRAARRYVPPEPIPGLPMAIPYGPPASAASGLGSPWGGPFANMPAGIGDSVLGFIYSSFFQGMNPNNWATPNTPTEATPMNVFGGGTQGGTDWGGLIGELGGQVAGIFAQKEQNKMLKRLMRGTRGAIGSGGYGGFNTFAPAAGVPAATGGAWAGTAGGLLGAGALGLLPELGDMLPGGLEESGTGLFGPDLFAVGATSRRQRMIDAVHPTTGERVYWRPVGRPIMFTGDAALLKRTRKMVRKMSSTAGCGVAGRTFRRRRR